MTHKLYVDCCPVCKVPNDETVLPKIRGLLGDNTTRCIVACCENCIHLIAVGISTDGLHTEAGEFGYDWFHEYYRPEEIKMFHELQEEMHHKAGHWG